LSVANRIPTKVLSVRLTIEALEAIERAAVDAKTTKSAYAARVLLEAASGKAPAPAKAPKPETVEAPPTMAKGIVLSDPKALEELRRIGVNINQIAHALNAGRPADHARLLQSIAQVFALLKKPDAFMRCVAELPAIPPSTVVTAVPQSVMAPAAPKATMPAKHPETSPPPLPGVMTTQASPTFSPPNVSTGYSVMTRMPDAKPQPIGGPAVSPGASPDPNRKPKKKLPRLYAERHWSPPPKKAPPSSAKPMPQEARRDSPHPQAWHQLQDRAPVRPARPEPAEDRAAGRLGFFRKLWGR
jgi:hypothetical protein